MDSLEEAPLTAADLLCEHFLDLDLGVEIEGADDFLLCRAGDSLKLACSAVIEETVFDEQEEDEDDNDVGDDDDDSFGNL